MSLTITSLLLAMRLNHYLTVSSGSPSNLSAKTYARGVDHAQSRYRTSFKTIQEEENRAQEGSIGSEAIVPRLSVAIEKPNAMTEDIDVFTAKSPEGRGILVGILERVLRPVADVFREVDGASEGHINVFEERKIQRRCDSVVRIQDNSSAVVAFFKCFENIASIIAAIFAGLDSAIFVMTASRRGTMMLCRAVWPCLDNGPCNERPFVQRDRERAGSSGQTRKGNKDRGLDHPDGVNVWCVGCRLQRPDN